MILYGFAGKSPKNYFLIDLLNTYLPPFYAAPFNFSLQCLGVNFIRTGEKLCEWCSSKTV